MEIPLLRGRGITADDGAGAELVVPGTQPATLTSAFQNAVRDLDPAFTPASLITGDQLRQRAMDDILVPSVMVGGSGGAVLILAALGMIQSDVVKLVIPGVAGGLFIAIVLVRLVVPWR
jgi:hypothetical protein